ncbi:hypothetical protein CEXT_45241 [Caerostris extrusa]|uniref:Uncharacterized protein n=1 Tax=Caerostris extrusa TaxID=172846 RepID=A0AAV4TBF5_CAEEX|nr:hypothetical protein CEXT_45241 [Caerostris extrusa]
MHPPPRLYSTPPPSNAPETAVIYPLIVPPWYVIPKLTHPNPYCGQFLHPPSLPSHHPFPARVSQYRPCAQLLILFTSLRGSCTSVVCSLFRLVTYT